MSEDDDPIEEEPELDVLEAFELAGRGTAFTIVAPVPPVELGDYVRLGGIRFTVAGMLGEPPHHVSNGRQAVFLKQAEA